MHSEKKKRDQDEGYHTSGTVSYTAQVALKGKGKGKQRPVSSAGSVSSRPRRDSKMSKETGDQTDASSFHSDADDGDEISAKDDDPTEQTAPRQEDEASDDVRECFLLEIVLTIIGLPKTPNPHRQPQQTRHTCYKRKGNTGYWDQG
jgi:hypothetical protein